MNNNNNISLSFCVFFNFSTVWLLLLLWLESFSITAGDDFHWERITVYEFVS